MHRLQNARKVIRLSCCYFSPLWHPQPNKCYATWNQQCPTVQAIGLGSHFLLLSQIWCCNTQQNSADFLDHLFSLIKVLNVSHFFFMYASITCHECLDNSPKTKDYFRCLVVVRRLVVWFLRNYFLRTVISGNCNHEGSTRRLAHYSVVAEN